MPDGEQAKKAVSGPGHDGDQKNPFPKRKRSFHTAHLIIQLIKVSTFSHFFYIIPRTDRQSIALTCLPFPFQQVGIRCFEFLAFPGPEAKAGRVKIMRRSSLPGPGGQAVLFPRSSSFPCRGDHPKRVTVRPIRPPRSAEAREDLSGELSSRRCFLRPPPLPPGHKIKFRGKRIPQSEGGKIALTLHRDYRSVTLYT